MRTQIRYLAVLWAVAGLVLASCWSPAPFWIDAPAYTSAVAQGRAVVHPPGYIGFLWLGKILHGLGLPPYRALQLISVASFALSVPLVWRACAARGGEALGRWFGAMYALSWVALNIAGVGTTHASDLLVGAAIARLLCLPGRAEGRWWWHPTFVATLVVAAAFRMSTVVMFVPLVLAVMALDFRDRWLWIAGALGSLAIGGVVWATLQAYGGVEAFRAASAGIHAVNSRSGLVSGGTLASGLANVLRAGVWCFLAAPVLPFALLAGLRSEVEKKARGGALLAGATLCGAVIIFGYLCVHPGYLAPMLGVWFALVAGVMPDTRPWRIAVASQVAFSVLLFLLARPVDARGSVTRAVANALVLQYGADAQRHARPIRTVTEWLIDSGSGHLAPAYRKRNVEADRK